MGVEWRLSNNFEHVLICWVEILLRFLSSLGKFMVSLFLGSLITGLLKPFVSHEQELFGEPFVSIKLLNSADIYGNLDGQTDLNELYKFAKQKLSCILFDYNLFHKSLSLFPSQTVEQSPQLFPANWMGLMPPILFIPGELWNHSHTDPSPSDVHALTTNVPSANSPLAEAIYDKLVDIDQEGKIIPQLAESWELQDGKILVFHLHSDVYFHNGEPLNSEIVVYNLINPTTLVELEESCCLILKIF